MLFDRDSFVELGPLVGGTEAPADALVAGFGKVDGRVALAAAEDFTVLGGSIGSGSMAKRNRVCELALQERVPLVFMLDGAGHRLTETDAPPGRAPNDLLALADLSGEVPMVCLVLGASAGHGALTSPLSDFTVMSAGASMFTGGPPLVKAALGEEVTKEELGGPPVCEAAGTVHNIATDDAGAIAMARRYLGYLPSHRGAAPPRREGPDTGPRLLEDLLDVIPPSDRRPYKMRKVIDRLVDEGSFFEVQPGYGASLITGLAFLGGRAAAIVANDPWVRSGSVDSAAAIKAMDFLDTVGNFDLPVIFLADNPGVMAGTKAEQAGILKWAGKMFKAQHRLRVPKISVTFRKAFGFGSSTMAANPFDHQTLMLSFPATTLSSMPAAPGGQSAKLDEEDQARVEEAQAAGPWRSAAGMGYDDIIDPRELRNAILAGLELSASRSGA
ncbi:MAG: acetyl-CoA carboxylase carboxyltransferase subunit [Deltaproteobacteria bacterium]|nr:acetyl-CoA carboxylase carboxyltransferase subunit [Deltaproteobacteria bacterium]